jgi:hypothetical protein
MNIVERSRVLTVFFAGLSGAFLTWQAHIPDLLWRVIVAGAGTAFLGLAIVYAQTTRGAR